MRHPVNRKTQLGLALSLALPLSLTACTDSSGSDDDDEAETDQPGINLEDDGSGDEEAMEEADAADESEDDGPDLNTLECERIDFVFVVDNSSSMADEQENLVAAVPGFVDAMQNALPDVKDLRVGVVDTDAYPGLGNPDPLDACPEDAECDSCDYTLGALTTKPNSAADPDASCEFGSEMPYMDGLSEDFAGEFECAALVGTEGNPIEQTASALVDAVSEDMNAEGECNEGFVRDNALLVFLVISDEEDNFETGAFEQDGSLGDPQRWHDAIIDAKGGKETNVVALGLIGGSPRFDDCEDLSVGLDGAEQTTRLQRFIDKFDQGFTGSVCGEGYDAFFNDALETVAEGCKFFIP